MRALLVSNRSVVKSDNKIWKYCISRSAMRNGSVSSDISHSVARKLAGKRDKGRSDCISYVFNSPYLEVSTYWFGASGMRKGYVSEQGSFVCVFNLNQHADCGSLRSYREITRLLSILEYIGSLRLCESSDVMPWCWSVV